MAKDTKKDATSTTDEALLQTNENNQSATSTTDEAPKSVDVSLEIQSDILTIGEDSGIQNVITVSVDIEHSNNAVSISKKVNVLINYPKTWIHPKFMQDGDVKEVSQETADSFVKLGIGKIVKK